VLYETGDTVTENALLAAAAISGPTIIKFASALLQEQKEYRNIQLESNRYLESL
jgi:hypothetical protein